MPTQSALRYSTLEPNDIIPVTYRIYCHSSRVIINTTQNKVNLSTIFTPIQCTVSNIIITLICGDVHVKRLDLYLWID